MLKSKVTQKRDYKRARRLLAEMLKEDRKRLGLSQTQYFKEVLSKHNMSVSYGFIQQWEKLDQDKDEDNKSLPDIVNFKGVAEYFGYSLDEFFDYLTGVDSVLTDEYEKISRLALSMTTADRIQLVKQLQDSVFVEN